MKNFVNNFQLTGFLGNDASIKSFETASKANFSLAVSKGEKKNNETKYTSAFINVEAWKKIESMEAFEILKKGNLITVEGYFKPEEWEDADGKKHNRLILTATKFYLTPDKE